MSYRPEPSKDKLLSPKARVKSKEVDRLSNAKAKVMVTLYRQKELLKKDILRKRALLEKELQYEIQVCSFAPLSADRLLLIVKCS